MAEDSSQADFVGRLALVLAALAVVFAVTVIAKSMTVTPVGGEAHVDQAGASNPAALPSPQPAKPTPANPNSAPAPAPAQMPTKDAAPAAQQPPSSPPAGQ